MRAIIFKLNAFGDNVVFVPAVQELRRRCPELNITLITTPNEAELYHGPLAPQEILMIGKKAFNKSHRKPWVLASWIWRVRRRQPDACLLPFDQGSAAHLIARLSGATIRIGGNASALRVSNNLTQDIPMPPDKRPVSWNWEMARSLATSMGRGEGWPKSAPPPDLRHLLAPKSERAKTRRRVVIHAGASRDLNRWSNSRFVAVAAALAHEFEVVWINHGEGTGGAPKDAVGVKVQTIRELAELLAGADLFLGNNSGPMHLANALGCQGVVVTGPSAMGWDPFWYPEHWTILRHPNLPCAPCGKPNEQVPGCANLESPMACLDYWTAAKVEAACRTRLDQPVGYRP